MNSLTHTRSVQVKRLPIIFFAFVSFFCDMSASASIISLTDLYHQKPGVQIFRCFDEKKDYQPFPLNKKWGPRWPSSGSIVHQYIVEVPDAFCYVTLEDFNRYMFVDNSFIRSTTPYGVTPKNLHIPQHEKTVTLSGRVAIIDHLWSGGYGHFISDVLSKLAMLEYYHVAYDYLIVSHHAPYMKELLDLWGIDRSKIIALEIGTRYEADTLIFTTELSMLYDVVIQGMLLYHGKPLMQHIKAKLLAGARKMNLNTVTPAKIFISKKDTIVKDRRVLNEDEVFAEFEKLGYVRCEMATMSMAEKIHCMSKATHVVSVVGSAGCNAMFMPAGSTYIEIQHLVAEATFCYLMQDLDINYRCIDLITQQDMIDFAYRQMRTEGIVDMNLVTTFIKNNLDAL